MQKRQLGRPGPTVSLLGFGSWPLGGSWGPQDDKASIAALHAAFDAGVTLVDTAPGYGAGRSERIVAEVVRQRPGDAIHVATKTPPAPGPWPPSPYCRWQDRFGAVHLRENVDQRLQALGAECLDLLQLHTWSRFWNEDPQPLLVLRRLKEEGKIGQVGVCAPEQDQNCVIELMRNGLVDTVQVVFNLFQQEAAAQLFSVAAEMGTGVLVRVALDEGSLTGKFDGATEFAADDFRRDYFAGDRLARTVGRVAAIADDLQRLGEGRYRLADAALKFAAAPPAVSSVLVGMRNADQVRQNVASLSLPDLPPAVLETLRRHHWNRGVWYAGK